jgi:hypothetical protein
VTSLDHLSVTSVRSISNRTAETYDVPLYKACQTEQQRPTRPKSVTKMPEMSGAKIAAIFTAIIEAAWILRIGCQRGDSGQQIARPSRQSADTYIQSEVNRKTSSGGHGKLDDDDGQGGRGKKERLPRAAWCPAAAGMSGGAEKRSWGGGIQKGCCQRLLRTKLILGHV